LRTNYHHLRSRNENLGRSTTQIVSEIILQLVFGIWFMAAYPIFAIVRRFIDSLSGEQPIPESIRSDLLQKNISDMLFSGHPGFSGDSTRRKFIEKLKIVHGAHPMQMLVWFFNANSLCLEKTIYVREDTEVKSKKRELAKTN